MDRRARMNRERKAKQKAAKEAVARKAAAEAFRKDLDAKMAVEEGKENDGGGVDDDGLAGGGDSEGDSFYDDSSSSGDSSSDDSDGDDGGGGGESVEDRKRRKEASADVTLIDGMMALIPFTQQYKDAKAMIAALDNLKGIKEEVARSTELMELVENGHYNMALEEIKGDMAAARSNQDFSTFNKYVPASPLPCVVAAVVQCLGTW